MNMLNVHGGSHLETFVDTKLENKCINNHYMAFVHYTDDLLICSLSPFYLLYERCVVIPILDFIK